MIDHTPGPWEARQLVGAGWEIFGVLPEGFKFDATYFGADGKTAFMLWHMHEQKIISFSSERWVQFETAPWEKMQRANAQLIAASPELLDACQELMRVAADTTQDFPLHHKHPALAKAQAAIDKALREVAKP